MAYHAPMKTILSLAALACAVASGPGQAADKPVTGLDVANYRNSIANGCALQGRRLKHAQADIDRRCKCVLDTLVKRVTEDEWKRAADFARQGKDKDEAAVLARHNAALKACSK